ncbi:unnamed protein product [Meloidogyne enterolobii]|uniref:Uncharacterized protein n=1 Tax=Meloidogyne enterolobii TaxID=390850 RepID=A0ACB1AZD0_MELEN
MQGDNFTQVYLFKNYKIPTKKGSTDNGGYNFKSIRLNKKGLIWPYVYFALSKSEIIGASSSSVVISSTEKDLVEEESSPKNHKISPKSPGGGKTKFQTEHGNTYANDAELETFIGNRHNLEKCHQIVFVLRYFVSKFAKHCNTKCIISKFFCCDFNDDEKNEIYDFIRELNENLVPSCDFLRKLTSDLARDSVDLK